MDKQTLDALMSRTKHFKASCDPWASDYATDVELALVQLNAEVEDLKLKLKEKS